MGFSSFNFNKERAKMKKLLFALTALVATTAMAADKGTEFKFGGEVRARYNNFMNQTLAGGSGARLNQNWWGQRNRFHVNALTGDKFQAYFEMLNFQQWGQSTSVPQTTGPQSSSFPATAGTGLNSGNAVQMQEAWMWWKLSDMASLKVGRQEMGFGDGQVIASGDWDNTPNAYEGIDARLTWDFLDLDVLGFKLADGVATITPTSSEDSEIVFYGLYGSLKNLPEVLKAADLYVLQFQGDNTTVAANYTGAAGAFPVLNTAQNGNWNLMAYGLRLKGEFAIIDYRLEGTFESGKQKNGNTAGTGDLTLKGSAYQAELGANLPEFMKGRVFARYFTASGNDSTDTTGASNNAYAPLFYDTHGVHGNMDMVGRSNLTDLTVGLTLMPMETTSVGLAGHMLSRTTNKATATVQGVTTATATNTENTIGSEYDLWAEHSYGSGFTALASLGYFSAGDYVKKANTLAASPDAAYKLMLQGKYSF
jgi:hypothetical protein